MNFPVLFRAFDTGMAFRAAEPRACGNTYSRVVRSVVVVFVI